MRNLFYLAKPSYGGWVTFTVHLSKKYNFNLYKIGNRTEILKSGIVKKRPYGYDVNYQNISKEDIVKYSNHLITAIDKHHYKYLSFFPDNTSIVIHDPTEVKGKSCQMLIENLKRFNVITIRKTVQKYLKNTLNIESTFLHHPFYQYQKTNSNNKYKNVSISRLDFDKHTDLILKANYHLDNINKINLYGAKNDLYVFHHLTNKLNLPLNNYHGSFKKCFIQLNDILSNSKYVIDLSAIKYDGGGTQYTFLEAIYHDCVLILNEKWINYNLDKTKEIKCESIFENNVNCLIINNEYDIINNIKNSKDINIEQIINNSKKLLEPHINVDWN